MEYVEPEILDIRPLIGPPILDTFHEVFGFTYEDAQKAYCYYSEAYVKNKFMYGVDLFDEVEETLNHLASMECLLGVATTKNEDNAKKIIKHLPINIPERYVFGTQNDGSRSDKAEIIEDFLKCQGIHDYEKVLMVGDRFYDIEGAKTLGIDSVGVTYGCGGEDELRAAGATHLISRFGELCEIIN